MFVEKWVNFDMRWFIKCIKNYAVFHGRASRAEFWYFILYWSILYAIVIVIDRAIGYSFINLSDLPYSEYLPMTKFFSEVGPLIFFYRPLTIIPSLAVGARRLHDINFSGKWSLLFFTPLVPLLMLLLTMKGKKDENEYGKRPD